ncbi:unnamed protein product, partial [Discosporangium mesarthrocarpum]
WLRGLLGGTLEKEYMMVSTNGTCVGLAKSKGTWPMCAPRGFALRAGRLDMDLQNAGSRNSYLPGCPAPNGLEHGSNTKWKDGTMPWTCYGEDNPLEYSFTKH